MTHNILIMGPIHVGKTLVSAEVARRTGLKLVQMDEERARIYRESGYSPETAESFYASDGIMGWYRYQKPYELLSVKQLLSENRNAVIDFGGGQSVYDDPEHVTEFLKVMASEPYSFLLMPYPSLEESLALLNSRTTQDDAEMNRLFIGSETSRKAARHIIYTREKTVAQIADEIMSIVSASTTQTAE